MVQKAKHTTELISRAYCCDWSWLAGWQFQTLKVCQQCEAPAELRGGRGSTWSVYQEHGGSACVVRPHSPWDKVANLWKGSQVQHVVAPLPQKRGSVLCALPVSVLLCLGQWVQAAEVAVWMAQAQREAVSLSFLSGSGPLSQVSMWITQGVHSAAIICFWVFKKRHFLIFQSVVLQVANETGRPW